DEARTNESPTLQAEQHRESCDCTGSPPPQCPGSPAICLQQLIRCCGGCRGASLRTGTVTAKMDSATIRTRQRDNAVITMSKLTPHESEAIMEPVPVREAFRSFQTPVRLGRADLLNGRSRGRDSRSLMRAASFVTINLCEN